MTREELKKALVSDTPRASRAHRTANMLYGLMRDYLPQGREVFDLIWEHLLVEAYTHNLEIISVPPEFDALNKMELERRMVETHPAFIKTASPFAPVEQPPKDQS